MALALDQGCIDLISATAELRLNAYTLSSPNSLTIQLTSDLIPSVTIVILVDSGSTHCFIDTTFVSRQQLGTLSITPIPLRLFDRTTNTVIHNTVKLPIHFTSGEIQSIMFYVTPLDVSCSAVLGHSWLTHYNPLLIRYWAASHSILQKRLSPWCLLSW